MARRKKTIPASRRPTRPAARLGSNELFHQALQAFQRGELKQARQQFTSLSKRHPDKPESFYFLSLIASQNGNLAQAEKFIKQALQIDTGTAAFHVQAANLHRSAGRLEQAESDYRKAIDRDATSLEALVNLGLTLKLQYKTDQAIAIYNQALQIRSDIPELHNNIGSAWLDKQEPAHAIPCFEQALKVKADFAGAWHNLGRACSIIGDYSRALQAYRQAFHLKPENHDFSKDLAAGFAQTQLAATDDLLESDLMHCLKLDRVDGGRLAQCVGDYLVRFSTLATLVSAIRVDSDYQFSEIDLQHLSNELLIVYLQREKNMHADLERLLVRLRRWLLHHYLHNKVGDVDEACFTLIGALAIQCFQNEYVFYVSEDEEKEQSQLLHRLQHDELSETDKIPYVLILCCYEPLYRLPQWLATLQQAGENDLIQSVVTCQLDEPEQEKALLESIDSFSAVNNDVSESVRDQYEQNPYPRWFHVDQYRPVRLKEYLVEVLPQSRPMLEYDPEKPDILVAGCGTGLQPVRNALRFPTANIAAIDLSYHSLAYALRKTNELKIRNVHYQQGDILALDRLGKQFDFIESFGVLHHMQDPMAGLASLTNCLRQGGYMRVGLYSFQARRLIREARDYIASRQYPADANGIRQCRLQLMNMPDDNPLSGLLQSPDFYSLSECRDLIFHVHEHQLDITFIRTAIQTLGLKFLGFEFPDAMPLNRFKCEHADDPALFDLDLWQQHEEKYPDTFVSQYVFWVTAE